MNLGVTSLTYAAWNGHKDVVEILLDQQANTNARDNFGRLHHIFVTIDSFLVK